LLKWFTSHRWLALLMGIIALAWSFCPQAERFERRVYSLLIGVVPVVSTPNKTAVVTLGDGSAATSTVSYPELAKLLTTLKSAGARAIGLTIPLDQRHTQLDEASLAWVRESLNKQGKKRKNSRKKGVPAGLAEHLDPDASLQEALRLSGRIVLGVSSAMSGGLTPLEVDPPGNGLALMAPLLAMPPRIYSPGPATLEMFSELTSAGIETPSQAGVMAASPVAIPFGGHYLPSLDLLLATRGLKVPAKALTIHPGQGVMVGTAFYATDAGLNVYPQRTASRIPVFSANDVFAGQHKRQLRGKVVLVGSTKGAMVQLPGGQSVSALAARAHTINALINESLVKVPYWAYGAQRGTMLLILIYLLLVPVRLRGWLGIVGGVVVAILILNGNLLLLILQNTWIPLALPVVFLLAGQVMVWTHHRFAHSFSRVRGERDQALVELAEQFRSQGKVDKAFDRLKACARSEPVMEGLYQVGLEYERRRQFAKALAAYDHIAQWNPRYRDITERRARHQKGQEPVTLAATMVSHSATTLVVDDPVVERPVLGRYEIERELGRGAMGTVYLGRDPRIGRTVAIKTLPLTEEFDSTQIDEVRRRFFQEAETAGRLSHPSIVTVYDAGEEHDLAYIAMDYIQGDSLDQHIRPDELLPMEDVFTIGILVAEALGYAHEQNVVHRDVKPGNIIYDRSKGQLKVTDFGIACLTDNSKTRTGTVLGSPYYMSPEQIAGKRVDGRTDLFSLGVTLYQLFSGHLPFEGDSLTNLMYQITNDKPVSVRKVRPELPACLTRIINKSLEKKPASRYENGQAMADALKRCAEQSRVGYRKS
jgi:CHASE2 domain-containing sensor protein/tRNA A-37 threonylcarbamoyl transferase component Bud32